MTLEEENPQKEFTSGQGIGLFMLTLAAVLIVGGISSEVFGFHVTAIVGELLILFIPLSFLSAGGYSLREFLSYRGKLNFGFWLWTMVAAVSLYVVISDISGYAHQLVSRPQEQKEALVRIFVAKSWSEYLFRLFAACILAGFCEEFAFRGFFQSLFSRKMGGIKGLVFTSFLFAFMHLDPWNFLGVFLLALFLGYLVILTKNLWVAILVHFFVNTIGFSLGFLSPQVGSDFEFTYPAYVTLFCTAVFIISLNFIRKAYIERNSVQTESIPDQRI